MAADNLRPGTLVINFAGEEAKEIARIGFNVTLVNKAGGQRIEKASGYIEAPPGSYTMTVSAKGYEDLVSEITLKPGQVLELLDLRLKKE
jgi:hypothetical protein